MLLSRQMITGFNTDVRYDGRVYHVQTEDRGQNIPVLESLVYIGGTIVAKKRTPYADQLSGGATEEMIASLLKRQHQVIIAAIKTGRIEDLIRHSEKEDRSREVEIKPAKPKAPSGKLPSGKLPAIPVAPTIAPPVAPPTLQPADVLAERAAHKNRTAPLGSPTFQPAPFQPRTPANSGPLPTPASNQNSNLAGLDLDQVISDYLKRNSEQGKLDLKVITPSTFIAGKSIGLRVQVAYGADPEPEAVVTIKVIGTAFKPQVYIGRASRDGIASFSLSLPAFTAGTAAIVIEAQSNRGRGDLKHLIRRA
jgi:hypothetical protein